MIVIGIRLKRQEKSYYCYASVIQAIVSYYTGKNLSQRSIARSFTGGGFQDPADFLVPRGLIRTKTKIFYGYVGLIPWKVLVRESDARRPIIAFVGHHYVLVIGYAGRNSRDPNRVYIFLDPLDPIPRAISFRTLKDAGYPLAGTGARMRGYYLTQRAFQNDS